MGTSLKISDLAFLGRVGNAGVTPLSFPGLLRWYKADSFTGIANDGDSIGGGGNTRGPWVDQTGSGDDATAVSGPIFKTNIVGTQPVIRFQVTGAGFMSFAPGALAGNFTVVCACRTASLTEDAFIFYNTGNGHQLRAQFFGSHDVVFYEGGGTFSQAFAGHNFEVVGLKRDATNISFRQNTTQFSVGPEAGSWTVTQIGNSALGSTMDIGEILIYNTAISEANLNLLYTQYLKPKWVTLP